MSTEQYPVPHQQTPLPARNSSTMPDGYIAEPKVSASPVRFIPWFLIFFSLFFMFGIVLNIGKDEPKDLIAGAIFFGAVIAVSIVWLKRLRKKYQDAQCREIEQAILTLAAERNGRLNVGELTMHTWMTAEQAAGELEKMGAKRLATPDFNEDGKIDYYF